MLKLPTSAALLCAIAIATAQAGQVPGPAGGTAMSKFYVETVGRMAYLWGWPLVNMANRAAVASGIAEPSVVGGMPIGYGRLAMLTDYMSPVERSIECPNQDVVYGTAVFDLRNGPIVLQVPDFGGRFWLYPLYDARTDEFSRIGSTYGSKPGYYLLVGPDWSGATPAGITAVVHSPTDLALGVARVFMDDTPADRAAIQPLLTQIDFYPLSEFDGKMKIKDWSRLPRYPGTWPPDQKTEMQWVNPATFFDPNQLPAVMKQVPPLPGEEALYAWIDSVLDAAARDPQVMTTLRETAVAADAEIWTYMQWRSNGRAVANGWNSPENNAAWGTDYLNRTATARSNMFENQPEETEYFYTDSDSRGEPLDGNQTYAVTFAKDQVPPVTGFWSLTLYNPEHFFQLNALDRYSLGTKNKTLKYNQDGSLTLYAGANSPGAGKDGNWLPAPSGAFSLYLRAYGAEPPILDGTWTPPVVERVTLRQTGEGER